MGNLACAEELFNNFNVKMVVFKFVKICFVQKTTVLYSLQHSHPLRVDIMYIFFTSRGGGDLPHRFLRGFEL